MTIKPSYVLRLGLIILIIAVATRGELHHFIRDFRLFTFCSLAAAAIVGLTLARGRIRDLLLIVATIMVGLSLVETTAIFLERRPLITMTEGWSVPRPIIGWGPAHAGVFHAKRTMPWSGEVIYDVDYTIDDHLLRETHSATTGPAIVFFGDSYTFGDGLNDPDTLPQQFATLTRQQQRVLNLGFTGYGPQQFLRGVETGYYDEIIGEKPRLFLFLTAAWHAQRTACKVSWAPHSPHYRLEGDGIAFAGRCQEGNAMLWHEFLYNTATYRYFLAPYFEHLTHNDVELYIRVLSEAIRKAKTKYGVETIIPYLRVPEAYLAGTGFTDEDIIKRLEASGAKVIDASLASVQERGLVLNIPNDGHPTALANRLRAGQLIQAAGIEVAAPAEAK